MHEEKRFLLDYRSGRSVQANEATHCRTSHVSHTNGKKRSLSSIWQQQKKRALRGPEVNYTSMKKLVLALVHASKRLKRYFKTQSIGQRADIGRLKVERPEEESLDTLMGGEEELLEPWILFTDGSSCTDGSGAGLILTNSEGMEFTYALRVRFDATNNEAEYEALIAGLKIAEQMGVHRSENKKADALSKIASTSFTHLSKQVLVEELKEKSISAVEVLAVVEEEGDTWMTLISKYLMDGILPVKVKKERAVKHKSWRFSISWSCSIPRTDAKNLGCKLIHHLTAIPIVVKT
ncbi:reverse transcriptase domain-containing protein [Tanacetum coccineum]